MNHNENHITSYEARALLAAAERREKEEAREFEWERAEEARRYEESDEGRRAAFMRRLDEKEAAENRLKKEMERGIEDEKKAEAEEKTVRRVRAAYKDGIGDGARIAVQAMEAEFTPTSKVGSLLAKLGRKARHIVVAILE